MGPASALLTSLRKTFRFSGRATRAEFWWSWPMLWLVVFTLTRYQYLAWNNGQSQVMFIVLVWLVMVPMVSVGTRRLADAGVWRWFFVVSVALGVVLQLSYLVGPASASRFWMMEFQSERDGVDLPLSGYAMHHLVTALQTQILPWAAKLTALLCLLLALLPSRVSAKNSGPNLLEATT